MKIKGPILPKNLHDPTGADRLERGAMLDFEGRLRKCVQAYQSVLDRLHAKPVINAKYEFALDIAVLMQMLDSASIAVDDILLQGGADNLWFFEGYGAVAYERGTAQEFHNLSRQSTVYKAGTPNLRALLNTPEYRLRVGLIRAREFEEVKGLSGQVKADMSRVLTDGIARGLNPLEIAHNLKEFEGIEQFRANRIARTEITTALRRARMDESDDADARYNLQTMQMHLSALGPTTRVEHAMRHGKLFTTDQQRDWWASDANSINCKCSTSSVLVDKMGKPLRPSIEEEMRANLAKWEKENAEDQ